MPVMDVIIHVLVEAYLCVSGHYSHSWCILPLGSVCILMKQTDSELNIVGYCMYCH